MAWANDDLVLYHGCTTRSLQSSLPHGIAVNTPNHNISVAAGALRPDFGRGFYATTFLRQAESWANSRYTRLVSKHPGISAVVLGLTVGRDALAALESLVFMDDQKPYYDFVTYCRGGHAPHNRQAAASPLYDVVYGPVSIALQRLVIKDGNQVSFHTAQAVKAISSVTVASQGSPTFP